jgi:hypothetical protein
VDVPPGSPFYDFVRCLACRRIVGGYPCGSPGEPCPGTYYRPANNVTRGQVSKIVSISAAFADPIPGIQQTFADVPPSSTFWLWVERLAGRGIISGYPCGGPFEPCIAPGNRPYFRPYNAVTRGQLAKMDALTAGFTETPTTQTFEDVPPGSTFYPYIETGVSQGIIQGYPCGSPGEPCLGPANRPYFRPFNNITRGQLSKVIALARGYVLPTPTADTFADVPPDSTFFSYIEAMTNQGIVSGYPCGGPGEPCQAPANRPYFRPTNAATRGQVSKFVTTAYDVP